MIIRIQGSRHNCVLPGTPANALHILILKPKRSNVLVHSLSLLTVVSGVRVEAGSLDVRFDGS